MSAERQTAAAAPLPVNARFGADFITRLAMLLPGDTMEEVARKVAAPVVGRRVPDRALPMAVRHLGRVVPPDVTVAEAGIRPFQSIVVDWASEAPPAAPRPAAAAPAPAQAPAPRPAAPPGPRTWTRFGAIRRLPSEYQIVTHDLNYTTRPGRGAALESNPTTPVNMWFRAYRDGSPLKSDDWNRFQDPDEMTYRRYVTLQDRQETVVEGIVGEFDRAGHDAGLAPPWLDTLTHLFTATRYPVHALQMAEAYLGSFAPASTITNCAAFATGDLLRRVSLLAYRTSQLRAAHPEAGFGTAERQVWESHPDWQPARRALEQALTAYDWGECLTAVNLALRPTLDELLLRQLGLVAESNGDHLTWLLLGNLAQDTERSARWSAALARRAVEERPDNAAVLRRWVARWAPRADEAAAGLAAMLSRLPEAGRDPVDSTGAAREERRRVLAAAGIADAAG